MDDESAEWLASIPATWQRDCVTAAFAHSASWLGLECSWVEGSLARGDGDRYSDVDLHCLVRPTSFDWWRQHWRDIAQECLGDLVIARTIDDGIIGGFCVTDDWRRMDVIVHSVLPAAKDGRVPLHDPDRLLANSDQSASPQSENTGALNEFFYYLSGNIGILIARGELVLAQRAVLELRHWWIRLQIVESARTGGAWHLDAALSPTQRDDLARIGCSLGSLEEIGTAAWIIVDGFTADARRTHQNTQPFPEAACQAAHRQLSRHAPRTSGADLSEPG